MTLRQRKKDRTRQTVQFAALELFERNGYSATTVEEIAAHAEVSPATFFRYFGSKEAVLFYDEDAMVESMVAHVAARPDRSATVPALADAIVAFAADAIVDFAANHDGQASDADRRMRIIMSTKELELRSLRLRHMWERAIAVQLAEEGGDSEPQLHQELAATLAVSCYVTVLRRWPRRRGAPLARLARQAFDVTADLLQPSAYASTQDGPR